MAIIKCPECGHEISDKAPFCPSCGVAIAGKITTCPECGKVYFSNLTECPQCHHHTVLAKEPLVESGSVAEDPFAGSSEPWAGTTNATVMHDDNVDEEPPHSSSRNNKIIIAVVVIVAVVVAGICYFFYSSAQSDRERQAYEYAMSSKDPQVLQGYLDQYLDAPEEHRDSIQAHLDILKQVDQDWTNALVSGSKSAIEQYLAQHPDSPFKAMAMHKIDSIDWAAAASMNTVEAVETYLEQHPDGEHIDDANNMIKALNSKTVQPEEKQMISSIFNSFFQSLNNRDEDALTSVVNPLLTKFLGKSNATRSDVITFMHKIYKSDVASMAWQSLGDYTISKKEIGDQQYEYTVNFSAMQSVTNSDNTSTDSKYKITATINPDGRISELNMIKILE